MKNLIFAIIFTFSTMALFAQDNGKIRIDSMTKTLIGIWNFEKVIDNNGKEIKSIEREVKGSPLGDKIEIKASGPNMILNEDGSCQLEYTPQNIDKGNWYLLTPDTLIFQFVTKKETSSYNMLKSTSEIFAKTLKYDGEGNIIENNSVVIIKLNSKIMLIQYESEYFQVYQKKK